MSGPLLIRVGLAVAAVSLAASPAISAQAPAPLKPVDASRFYSGEWHEIGRRPMKITDGCVAGATQYRLTSQDHLQVLDTCHQQSPSGRMKSIGGPARIVDPGTNDKIHVSYRLFGVFTIGRDYWVLDRADDYSWFISSDPGFNNLWIYSRAADLTAPERQTLVNRAQALGYDVGKLEFPAQP